MTGGRHVGYLHSLKFRNRYWAGRHLGFHLKIKKWCVELLLLIIGSCTKNFTQLSETVPELQALKENPRWRPPAAILDFIWKSKNDMCGIVDTYNRKLYKKFHAIIWNRSWTAGIKRKSKMAAGRHLGFHLKIKKWCVELFILIIGSCTKNFTQLSETVPELQKTRWKN